MPEEDIMPQLAHIWLYPIKSLDGISVEAATVLPSGALQHDREFAIADSRGKIVNAKRFAQIHQIRANFHLEKRQVSLGIEGQSEKTTFHLDCDRTALEAWLSDFFEFPVHLIQNTATGYPDDSKFPGPTVISTATLETVATWFPDLSVSELRQRLRTNLEISHVPAFWEDHQLDPAGQGVPFQIGEITFLGMNPCQRCVVPTRNPHTGIAEPGFQRQFAQYRQQTLPPTVPHRRFNHYYRLCLNTRVIGVTHPQPLQIKQRVHA